MGNIFDVGSKENDAVIKAALSEASDILKNKTPGSHFFLILIDKESGAILHGAGAPIAKHEIIGHLEVFKHSFFK
jgi:hypothetical protein